MSLIKPEIKIVLQGVLGQKSTILGCTFARIYTAGSEETWKYSRLQGILCLVWDRELYSTPFLRMFHPENFETLIFEAELYIDFYHHLTAQTSTFYYFEYLNAFIGIQFVNANEAQSFVMLLMNQTLKSDEEFRRKKNSSIIKQEKEGMFGIRQTLKSYYHSFFKDNKQQESQISKPQQVIKEVSVQYDPLNQQLNVQEINPQMQSILQKAGITQKDLNNQEISTLLVTLVQDFQNNPNQIRASMAINKSKQVRQSQHNANIKNQLVVNNNNDIFQSTIVQNNNNNIPPPPPVNLIPQAPNLNIPQAPNLNIPQAPNLNIPQAPSITIPLVPQQNIPSAPNLNIPQAPNQDVTKSPKINVLEAQGVKKEHCTKEQVDSRLNMLDEIRKGQFQLKKYDPSQDKKLETLNVQVKKEDEETLADYLSKMIQERRQQIRKNYRDQSSDSENSDSD